jgi:hypothetical protein
MLNRKTTTGLRLFLDFLPVFYSSNVKSSENFVEKLSKLCKVTELFYTKIAR